MRKCSHRCRVSKPITACSVTRWVSTPHGMKCPQRTKAVSAARPLERGFEWSQVPLFLLDECPQLIQLTLGETQMAKVIRHDLRTMRPETPQPLIHRVFIDLQDACRRSHAQPFCQELCSQGILPHIRANSSIGCPSSGRYHIS